MIKFFTAILVFINFSFASNINQSHICNKDEITIFSFKMQKSNKSVAICQSKLDENSYIVYRYGTIDNIELEYPKNKQNSWKNFQYNYYFRAGMANASLDLNNLIFNNGPWTYTIYEEYAEDDNIVGVRLKNNETKKKYDLKGDINKIKGSLSKLRDTKITQGSM
jgi:hypothetical protein